MHLKGELEPLVLVVDFSVFSCISVVDTEFDESVFTSRTIHRFREALNLSKTMNNRTNTDRHA